MSSIFELDNGRIIDTSELTPHVECYFTDIIDGKPMLYCESIDGIVYPLGAIKSNG